MENYPFCTIDPHIAITEVPDKRIETLQKFYKSEKVIPATVTFVDIAGLVKGAATGEGLGNQFLSHIREVDLILHVLRCFEDPTIIRSTPVNPLDDYEVIMAELMLKDLESIDKRIPKIEKQLKGKLSGAEQKNLQSEMELLKIIHAAFNQNNAQKAKELLEKSFVETIPLLSTKNFLIIANVDENELGNEQYKNNKHYQSLVATFGNRVIPVSARVEYELTQLNETDAREFMNELGIATSGLEAIIGKTYDHLGLITFFTCGPREIHAWPIKKGTSARKAAGEIHSDLERGFICSETFNYDDILKYPSETAIKQAGRLKIEGSDYIVRDGDIINIRFNV